MSRPTIDDYRYSKLDSTEALRQSERDAMIYDQNKLLSELINIESGNTKCKSTYRTAPETFGMLLFNIIFVSGIFIGLALIFCNLTFFSVPSVIFLVIATIVTICGSLSMIEDYISSKKRNRN